MEVSSTEVWINRLNNLNATVVFALFTILVMIVTAIPYVLAYRGTPVGMQFMGILLNVPDTAQYLSWARESSHHILIEDKLTPEHGGSVYLNVFWLLVGRFAAAFGIGYAEAAQAIRPIAGGIYLGAIYWFVGLVFRDHYRRWTAALVAILGGGLGWLLVVHKVLTGAADVSFPLDLYVIEANTFLSVLAFPLQAMAGGLLVLSLGLSALAFEKLSLRWACLAGLTALALGTQHGYDLIVLYAVVGLVALVMAGRNPSAFQRPLLIAACVCAWSIPVAAWSLAITRLDPVWRGMLAQYGNAGVYTPPPPHLVILMGLPLLLSLSGVVVNARPVPLSLLARAICRIQPLELLLWTWAIVGAILPYIPTDFQIKMLVGWQVPLSILGTRAFFTGVGAITRRAPTLRSRGARVLAAGLLLAATVPTSCYLFGWRIVDLNRHEAPYYLSTDNVSAMHWLEENTNPSEVVLSSLTIGEFIPSETGNNAFLAHWASTLDFREKTRDVGLFFAATTPDQFRPDLLTRFNVRYVFYGPSERTLGDFQPDNTTFLSKVYANDTVRIYRVILPASADRSSDGS